MLYLQQKLHIQTAYCLWHGRNHCCQLFSEEATALSRPQIRGLCDPPLDKNVSTYNIAMTPKAYNILGWFFFTLVLVLFLVGVRRAQQPPAGNQQTMIWIIVGAILLYLITGLYTFSQSIVLPSD